MKSKSLTVCTTAILAMLFGCVGCQKSSSRVYKIGRAQPIDLRHRQPGPVRQGPHNYANRVSPSITPLGNRNLPVVNRVQTSSMNNQGNWGNSMYPSNISYPQSTNINYTQIASQPQSNAQTNEYHVGAGDILTVKVFQLLEIDKDAILKVQVDRQGTIYLPMVNQVEVSGKTVGQIKKYLTQLLGSKFIKDPKVSVSIEKFNSKIVMVEGSVRRPGEVALESDTSTLLDVIAQVGGLTASTAPQIEILRGAYNPSGNNVINVQGKSVIMTNYSREIVPVARLFAEDGQRQINPIVNPGDIIKVRPSSEGYVYMAGEVNRPGSIQFRRPQTILHAMSMAGGPTNIAKEGECKIIRRLTNGGETEILIDLDKVRSGEQGNLLLAQNDTILVPVDPVKKFFDELNNMFRRGVSLTYSPNDALGIPAAASAGGF